jgi:hypothetical protein
VRAVALLVVALAGAGCGRGAEDSDVRAVTARFSTAVESQDGERACAQLSPQTRAELEKQEQRECRRAVTGLRLRNGAVTGVQVYMLNAMVELSTGETEFLEKGQEGWRLSAVGCTPQRDTPLDQPYDCELED